MNMTCAAGASSGAYAPSCTAEGLEGLVAIAGKVRKPTSTDAIVSLPLGRFRFSLSQPTSFQITCRDIKTNIRTEVLRPGSILSMLGRVVIVAPLQGGDSVNAELARTPISFSAMPIDVDPASVAVVDNTDGTYTVTLSAAVAGEYVHQ